MGAKEDVVPKCRMRLADSLEEGILAPKCMRINYGALSNCNVAASAHVFDAI